MRSAEKFASEPTPSWLLCSGCLLWPPPFRHVEVRRGDIFSDMQTLRTPDDRFADLTDFPYIPRYCEVDDDEGGRLRMAWVEDGPP